MFNPEEKFDLFQRRDLEAADSSHHGDAPLSLSPSLSLLLGLCGGREAGERSRFRLGNIIFHPKRDPHPLSLHFPETRRRPALPSPLPDHIGDLLRSQTFLLRRGGGQ